VTDFLGINMAGITPPDAGAARPYAGSGITFWLSVIPSQNQAKCRFDVMTHRARRLQESSP
jgi:hypothetical protein